MPEPTYQATNVCQRDPEIVSSAHCVLAEPKATKLLAYTTDDLKMKKNSINANFQPDSKVFRSKFTVLHAYS